MRTIRKGIDGLRRFLADFKSPGRRAGGREESDDPVRHVEQSLDILERTFSRLASGEKAEEEESSAETGRQLKLKIKRLEKRCERYAAQVRRLKQSLDTSTSAFQKKERELTIRIRAMAEDADSSTVLIEQSLREIEKLKKAYNALRNKTDSEDRVAGRIEEETRA